MIIDQVSATEATALREAGQSGWIVQRRLAGLYRHPLEGVTVMVPARHGEPYSYGEAVDLRDTLTLMISEMEKLGDAI